MTTRQLLLKVKALYPWLPDGRAKSAKKYELFYQATKTSTKWIKWLDDKVLRVTEYMEAEETMMEREKLQEGSPEK